MNAPIYVIKSEVEITKNVLIYLLYTSLPGVAINVEGAVKHQRIWQVHIQWFYIDFHS